MQSFIKTIVSAIQCWVKGIVNKLGNNLNERLENSKADWNQYDPNSDDYVKNRTHYESRGRLVGELHFSTPRNGEIWGDVYFNLQEGKTYVAIYNSVEYVIPCEISGYLGTESYSGIPFYIGDTGDEQYVRTFDVGLLDLEVYAIEVKQLDLKYIPDEVVQTVEEVQVTKDIAISAQTTADAKMDAVNPTGSGAVSIGRLSDSIIGDNSTAIGDNVSAHHYAEVAFGAYNKSINGLYVSCDITPPGTRAPTVVESSEVYCSASFDFDGNTGLYTLVNPERISARQLNLAKPYFCMSSADLNNLTGIYKVRDNFSWFTYYGRLYMYVNRLGTQHRNSTKDKLLIIGNGSSKSKCSNAHTVDWEGNAWYQGDVYVGSTSGTDKDDGSKKLATEEYVKTNVIPIPNTAEVGQVITVKAVDENGKPTEWETTDIPLPSTPNWSASKGEPGHIKNRTHYVAPPAEILSETHWVVEDWNDGMIGLNNLTLVEDFEYLVKWNGTEHKCKAIKLPASVLSSVSLLSNKVKSSEPEYIVAMGNVELLLGTGNSGFPFAMAYIPDFGGTILASIGGAIELTLSITQLESVKKLDSKYLGLDWIPTTKSVKDYYCPETVFEVTTSSSTTGGSGIDYYGGSVPFGKSMEEMEKIVVEGLPIKVNLDGIVYDCVVTIQQPSNPMDFAVPMIAVNAYQSNPNAGPFFIYFVTGFACYMPELGNHTISIYTESVSYNTIPGNYLPEGGSGYTEYGVGGALIPLQKFKHDGLNEQVYLSLNYVPITEGKTYVVNYDGIEYECVATKVNLSDTLSAIVLTDGEIIDFVAGDYTSKKFGIAFFSEEDMDGVGAVLLPLDGLRTEYTVGVFEKVETIHKIDPKYLPEVGGSGGGYDIVAADSWDNFRLLKGSFSAVVEKLKNYDIPTIVFLRNPGERNGEFSSAELVFPTQIGFSYDDDDNITNIVVHFDGGWGFTLENDDTASYWDAG